MKRFFLLFSLRDRPTNETCPLCLVFGVLIFIFSNYLMSISQRLPHTYIYIKTYQNIVIFFSSFLFFGSWWSKFFRPKKKKNLYFFFLNKLYIVIPIHNMSDLYQIENKFDFCTYVYNLFETNLCIVLSLLLEFLDNLICMYVHIYSVLHTNLLIYILHLFLI